LCVWLPSAQFVIGRRRWRSSCHSIARSQGYAPGRDQPPPSGPGRRRASRKPTHWAHAATPEFPSPASRDHPCLRPKGQKHVRRRLGQ
jgi:hypothetical protein